MGKQLHDALRHLEKDMVDIMGVLADDCTTEIILNPYQRKDGSYSGYVLVDQHGRGLHNLAIHDESTIDDVILANGDLVVYKYLPKSSSSALFWVRLENAVNESGCSRQKIDDLSNISFCLKSYFAADSICQSDDVRLLEYADLIESGQIDYSLITANYSIEGLLEWVNNNLPIHISFRLGFTVIGTKKDEDIPFVSYPNKLIKTKLVKMSATRAETIMSVLASITGKFIHHKNPYLECQIPKYGHRFTGVIPPVVPYPSFCIRKHAPQIFTLEDLVNQGVLQVSSLETILSWIRRKFNILLAGGTGSGKTTLANAILHEIGRIFPETRMLIIEDVPELKFNTTRSIGFTVGEFFSMYEALRTTLRFKPDRIIMGEVRGSEAYTLLKAWNTGHPGGIATIHANGVNEALYRFESCIRDHPESAINRQEIGFTINGIISIQNITLKEVVNGETVNMVRRRVTALRQILQYDVDKDIYQDIIYDQEHFIT